MFFAEFFSITIIAIYFTIAIIIWVFPLQFFLKNKTTLIQYLVPAAFSFQIIIGYVFYTFNLMKYFSVIYFVMMLLLNIALFYRHQLLQKKIFDYFNSYQKKEKLFIVGVIFTIIPLLYTHYYDSFQNLAPGNNDTYSHIGFLKQITESGYIHSTFYAPGFHLLMFPLTKLLSYAHLSRFAGPTLSLFIVLGISLVLKPLLKTKQSFLLLILLFSFPIFNQLTLQTISFFSSSLTFLFFSTLIVLYTKPVFLNKNHLYALLSIISVALALSVPYFFVQLIPSLGLFWVATFLFKRRLSRQLLMHINVSLIISFLGLMLGYAHVLLQTSLRGSTYFPDIPTAQNMNHDIDCDGNNIVCTFFFELEKNETTEKTTLPILKAGYDLLSIKDVRTENTILSLGAYSWILFSLFLFAYALKKKDHLLIVVSVFSIFFGISAQTGVVELGSYKGRSGWYLLLLCLIGCSVFFDRVYQLLGFFSQKIFLLTFVLLFISCFLSPAEFYRPYNTEPFDYLEEILETQKEQTIVFARIPEISLVSDKVIYIPLNEMAIQEKKLESGFVVVQTQPFNIDPILSQYGSISDSDFKQFYKLQEINNQEGEKINILLEEKYECISKKAIIKTEKTTICKL